MSWPGVFTIVLLVCFHLASSYAVPATVPLESNNAAQQLTADASKPSVSNRLSLNLNIRVLLTRLRRSQVHTLRRAALVSVTLSGTPATRDYHNLDRLTVRFFPRTPPAADGDRDQFLISNEPHTWDHWGHPKPGEVAPGIWTMYQEFSWEGAQAALEIDMASRLLKVAGYRGPFWRVTIAQWREFPLSYCFEFGHGEGMPGAVRVEILTGKVREQEEGCPSEDE